MQTERQSIQAQFKKLKDILEYEELRELQNLENEEKAVLGRLAEAEDELAQHSQLLTDLISDLEHRLQGSTMDMLQVRLGKKRQHLRFEKNEDQVSFSPVLLCSSWW